MNHPNIAHVYEIDELDGQHFIIMEFIDGHKLRELIYGRWLIYLNAEPIFDPLRTDPRFAELVSRMKFQ